MPELKNGDVALVFSEGDTVGEAINILYDIPEGGGDTPVPDHFHACAAVYNWIVTDPSRMKPIMQEYTDALNKFCDEREAVNENTESEEEEGNGGSRETTVD